jgi:tRNA 2-thiouridine synthesizing protein A
MVHAAPPLYTTILTFIPHCSIKVQYVKGGEEAESEVEVGRRQENLYGSQEVKPGITEGKTFLPHFDRELDLKGKICPYPFVESMLALEEMETGQVLCIILDYPDAACDVPQSLKREGYEILEVSKINDTDWAISVRNKPFEG